MTLDALLDELQLTPHAAAQLFGVHHSTMYRYLLGQFKPSRPVAERIVGISNANLGTELTVKQLFPGRLQGKTDKTLGRLRRKWWQ